MCKRGLVDGHIITLALSNYPLLSQLLPSVPNRLTVSYDHFFGDNTTVFSRKEPGNEVALFSPRRAKLEPGLMLKMLK